VVRATLGRRFDLIEERRDEVERDLDARKTLEAPRHVHVVLGGVEPNPRQARAAAARIAIVGLVLVPEQDQLDADVGAHETFPPGTRSRAGTERGVRLNPPSWLSARRSGYAPLARTTSRRTPGPLAPAAGSPRAAG